MLAASGVDARAVDTSPAPNAAVDASPATAMVAPVALPDISITPTPDDPWLVGELIDAVLRVNIGAPVWSEQEFAGEVLRREMTLFLEARAQRAKTPTLTWDVVRGFRELPLVQRELRALTNQLNGTELVAAAYLWAYTDLAGSHCPSLTDDAMEGHLDPVVPLLCDRSSVQRAAMPSLESLRLRLPGSECSLTSVIHSLDRQMVAMQNSSVGTMSAMIGGAPAALHTSKIGAPKPDTLTPANLLSRMAAIKSRAASFTLELERWRLNAPDPTRAASIAQLDALFTAWSQTLDQPVATNATESAGVARGVQTAENLLDLLEMITGLADNAPGTAGPSWSHGFNERVMLLAIQCGAGHSPGEAKAIFEHFAPHSTAFPDADAFPQFDLSVSSAAKTAR